MAFGDVVQTAHNSVASGVVTVTFSAATAGNLLIFGVVRSSALGIGATWGTPTGWTMLTATPENTGNVGAAWYYKIAAGGETSVTSTESTPPGNGRGIVVEFAGPFAASPLNVSAENESNLATVVTSQSSGTTPTTTQATALAVAFFGVDSAINADDERSYSNSFSEVIYADPVTNNARAAAVCARRVLTATGAYSTTFSCTDTGDEMYGAIAVFLAQSGGAQQLTVQDATHAQTADGASLVGHAVLAAQDATHAQTADGVSLVGHAVLAAQDATHAQTADGVSLVGHAVLAAQDATHAQTADGVSLVGRAALTVQDATHAQTADGVLFAAAVTPVVVLRVARRGVLVVGGRDNLRCAPRRVIMVSRRQRIAVGDGA